MFSSVLEESRSKVFVVGPDLVAQEARRRTKAQAWPILLNPPLRAGHSSTGWTWRFRPQVTLIVQDDAARILDTHCGNFYALDPIGTRMLFATLEAGSEAMARTLARDYQVPEEQVGKDWAVLVEGLHQAGLTESVRLQPGTRRPPGGFRIWVWLTLAWLSFSLLGWERTLRVWRRRSPSPVVGAPAQCQAIVAEVDRLVRRLASRHPLNPQCKERALVSWHVLRRMGLPARLLMGVMLYPFTAHAWAECQGQIVGDDRGRCEHFVPVAVYE
jgi:Transglutaminase-like superfamily